MPGRWCEAEGSEGSQGKLTKGDTQHWLARGTASSLRAPRTPSGHCSALSCCVAPCRPSPLLMPCLILVKMRLKEGSSTIQGLVFCNLGVCLDFGGVIYTSPRKILGAKTLGGPKIVASTAASHQRPRAPRGERGHQMGPVGQTFPGGSKAHMCRLCSLVPPVNAHHWVWGAGCHGDGRRTELGVGGLEKYCSARGLILYAILSKPTPSACLAGHHKPRKLSHNSAKQTHLWPSPPHHERTTATNRDLGAPGVRSGF